MSDGLPRSHISLSLPFPTSGSLPACLPAPANLLACYSADVFSNAIVYHVPCPMHHVHHTGDPDRCACSRLEFSKTYVHRAAESGFDRREMCQWQLRLSPTPPPPLPFDNKSDAVTLQDDGLCVPPIEGRGGKGGGGRREASHQQPTSEMVGWLSSVSCLGFVSCWILFFSRFDC